MNLHAVIKEELTKLATQPSLLQERAQQLCSQWMHEPQNAIDWLDLMLETERLVKIGVSGHANDATLIAQLDTVGPKKWSDIALLPCDPQLPKRFGQTMMEQVGIWPAPSALDANTLVRFDVSQNGRQSLEACVGHCLRNGVAIDVMMEYPSSLFDTVLVDALSMEEVKKLADFNVARNAPVTHNIGLRSEEVGLNGTPDQKKFTELNKADAPFKSRRVNDEVSWITTRIPARSATEVDGFANYSDYLQYFFDAADQPWAHIKKAQAKLIEAFNTGKELHITNSDGTDLHMSIDGHTFANSVVRRNLPGSEFFSAPNRDSVSGTIVSKGSFVFDSRGAVKTMKDITLTIENGRIVKAHAAEGNDALQEIISSDDGLNPADPKFEGARHIGEIGIGTNPFLHRHLANNLLVEKISGSFHVAIGYSYGNKYLGETVLMDNGNRSGIHHDITTMLHGKDGRIELDGHLIQKDGVWMDCPELGISKKDVDVLNCGWAALSHVQQPEYWRRKLAENKDIYIQ